jgi:plasmid segregation protein ParM
MQYFNVQRGVDRKSKPHCAVLIPGKTTAKELVSSDESKVCIDAHFRPAQKNIRRCIMRIAVDVGYSSVKGLSEHGRVMFPSITAPMAEDLLAGAIHCGALQHSVRIHRDLNNVEEHLVGDAALMSTSATGFLAQREKPDSIHDLLLLTAAYLLASGHEDCLDLAIGLPISYFKAQRDELKGRLDKLSTWVSVGGGAERCLHFDRVSVIPQGAGALMTAGALPGSGLVALLDIGSYTTDYLVFDVRGGQPVPVSECCGSIEAGVRQR